MGNEDETIEAISQKILDELNILISHDRIQALQSRRSARLTDIFDKFKIWSHDIGALQTSGNPDPLNNGARASAHLQNRFLELLKDMWEDIQDSETRIMC
jgi:hypothetical protein